MESLARIKGTLPRKVGLSPLKASTRASATTEYGILAGVVALTSIVAISALGFKVRDMYASYTASAAMAARLAQDIADNPQLLIQNSGMFQSLISDPAASDWVLGTPEDEMLTLTGLDAVDKIGIKGFSGNDDLYGRSDGTPDKFIGGTGDDTIRGLDGPDEYIFEPGFGNDLIEDLIISDGDQLTFTGFEGNDLKFDALELEPGSFSFSGLRIFDSQGNSVKIPKQFNGNLYDQNKIETIVIDGLSLDQQAMRDKRAEDQKSIGRNTIYGTSESDTFVIRKGEGEYTIYEATDWHNGYNYSAGAKYVTNRINFEDFPLSEVTFERNDPYSMDIDMGLSDGRVIKLYRFFERDREIDEMNFTDAQLDYEQIMRKTMTDQEGRSTVYGTPRSDTVAYHRGTNVPMTYINNHSSVYNDTLELLDFTESEVTFERQIPSNTDLTLIAYLPDGEQVTLKNELARYADWGVASIKFADATLSNRDAIDQKLYEDSKARGLVYGRIVSDVHYFRVGDGTYSLRESDYTGDSDRLIFVGMAKADVNFLRDGNDLVATNRATGDQVRIIDQFVGYHYIGNSQYANPSVKYLQFTDGTLSGDAISNKVTADAA